ncbi:unnamed protein product [Ilex paraguariensis]|uniref:Uncharacterized protein n=1 Tax=Ilex paraguariensis TaxID=185542 RepID=A0ABC8T6P3_9AQUA
MATSKNLMDISHPAKRLKRVSSTPTSSLIRKVITTTTNIISSSFDNDHDTTAKKDSSSSSCLTPEQKCRVEFNKSLAKSRRNLKICSEKFSTSTAGERVRYVRLIDLLVEETWLEALPGELEKPYAKKLCYFVRSEICNGGVPIYPPQHLIFNALNTTPFDRVKAVIIGQVLLPI